MQLRHYLISSGLSEIVEGTSIYKRFHNVFASEYWFEAYDLPYPKRVITDTGKTQYLFRINKGVEDVGLSINQHMQLRLSQTRIVIGAGLVSPSATTSKWA